MSKVEIASQAEQAEQMEENKTYTRVTMKTRYDCFQLFDRHLKTIQPDDDPDDPKKPEPQCQYINGFSDKKIAELLDISATSVRYMREEVFGKLASSEDSGITMEDWLDLKERVKLLEQHCYGIAGLESIDTSGIENL